MSHTPGPWRVIDHNNAMEYRRGIARDLSRCRDDAEYFIAGLTNVFVGELVCMPWPINDANIRLIAAAPELLEACRGMAKESRHWPAGENDRLARLRDLLRRLQDV